MKILNAYKKFSNLVFNISCVLIFILMVFMTADVIKQVFTGSGFLGSYEIVEIMMVCIVYFAFCYTQIVGKHIAVDLIKNNLPVLVQKILDIIISLATIAAGYLMIYCSWKNIFSVWEDGFESPTLGIPLFPFYAVVFFGSCLLELAFVMTLIENIIRVFAKDGEELIQKYKAEEDTTPDV